MTIRTFSPCQMNGRLLIFRNFSDLPGAYEDPPLIDFEEKISDQDVFTPDLLYFQFF